VSKKRKKEEFIDDGRTIANMNVDGMPWYIDEAKRKKTESEPPMQLSRKERRAMLTGIMAAVLLVGLVFAVAILLFILFCIHIWFQ
jgi:hypothetical protein